MDDYESDEYAPIDELFGAGSEDETLLANQQAEPALLEVEAQKPLGLFDLPQDGPDLFGNLPDLSKAKAISAAIRPAISDEPAEPDESLQETRAGRRTASDRKGPASARRRTASTRKNAASGEALPSASDQSESETPVKQKSEPERSRAKSNVPEMPSPTSDLQPTPDLAANGPVAEAGESSPTGEVAEVAASSPDQDRAVPDQPAVKTEQPKKTRRRPRSRAKADSTGSVTAVTGTESDLTGQRQEEALLCETAADPTSTTTGAEPVATAQSQTEVDAQPTGARSEPESAVDDIPAGPVSDRTPTEQATAEMGPVSEQKATSAAQPGQSDDGADAEPADEQAVDALAEEPAPALEAAVGEASPVAASASSPEPVVSDQPVPTVGVQRQGGSVEVDEATAPLALYRRYRPDTFADVIGQEHVTDPLQRALVNGKVNHAYLFSGPRGCGKTSSARILARCLNCAEGPTPTPCGRCRSCTDLARTGPGSIDVIEIDAASHGGVDDARDLRERAFFAPVHSRYKIYIIDEAHMVTTAGFNALLKLVEEPPPHVKFIFATTEPEKVIGTIRSRTHHYPFRLVPPRVLIDYLARLCQTEGVDVDPTVLPLVVRAGAGSVRDSLSILDQLLGAADISGVGYPQAAALLGYTPDTLLDEVVDAIAAGDASAVFATVDKVIEVGQDPRRFAEDLLRRLRDLIIVSAVPDAATTGLIDVAADQAQRFATQVAGIGRGELTRAAEVLAAGLTEMRGTTAPRLHLELMCARILLPGADDKERGLNARLDRLERRVGMLQDPGPAQQWADTATQRVPVRQDPADQGEQTGSGSVPGGVPRPRGEVQQGSAQNGAGSPPASASPPAQEGQNLSSGAGQRPVRQRPGSPNQVATPQAQTQVEQPANQDLGQRPTEQPQGRNAEPNTPGPGQRMNPQQTATGSSSVGQLTAVELRRIWPTILQRLKERRRYTWMVVSQNAQVLDLTEGKLTLGFSNAGARDSFSQRGGTEDLNQTLAAEIGVAPHIIAVLAEGDSDTGPQQRPVGAPAEPAAPPSAPAPASAPPQPEEQISEEDDEIIDQSLSVEELLATQLGAEVIHEQSGQ